MITKFKVNTGNLIKKARFLNLAGDETRIKILCYLFQNRKACVSEIAGVLNMTLPNISQHLRVMKDNGLLESKREGNTICYSLVDTHSMRYLEKIICK